MITIRYDPGGLSIVQRAMRLLTPARISSAMGDALRDAGKKMLTQVRRDVKEQANFKAYRTVTQAITGLNMREALTYRIRGAGKGVAITEVKGLSVNRKGVRSAAWGVVHQYSRSFKNRGYKARLTASRFPVRTLRGPSPPKEMLKGKPLSNFQARALTELDRQVIARLRRILP